jgi:hypothetical protein
MINMMNKEDLIKELYFYSTVYKLTKQENEELKERIDKIRSICNLWNYNLPDEALDELKEILEDE